MSTVLDNELAWWQVFFDSSFATEWQLPAQHWRSIPKDTRIFRDTLDSTLLPCETADCRNGWHGQFFTGLTTYSLLRDSFSDFYLDTFRFMSIAFNKVLFKETQCINVQCSMFFPILYWSLMITVSRKQSGFILNEHNIQLCTEGAFYAAGYWIAQKFLSIIAFVYATGIL